MGETISGPFQSRSPPMRPHIDESTERRFSPNAWISGGSWGLGGWAFLRSERKWGIRLTSGWTDTLNHSRLRGEELKQSQKTKCSGWFWVSGWSMGLSGTRCADSAPLASYLAPEGSYISHLHCQPKQHFDHTKRAGKIHRPSWITNMEQKKRPQHNPRKWSTWLSPSASVTQTNRNPKCEDSIAHTSLANVHSQVHRQQCHSWKLKHVIFWPVWQPSILCMLCCGKEKIRLFFQSLPYFHANLTLSTSGCGCQPGRLCSVTPSVHVHILQGLNDSFRAIKK